MPSTATRSTNPRGGGSRSTHHNPSSSTFITGTDLTENDAIVPVQPLNFNYNGAIHLNRHSREEDDEFDSYSRSLVPANQNTAIQPVDELEQLKRMVFRTRKKLDNRMSEMKSWQKDVEGLRKDMKRCGKKTEGKRTKGNNMNGSENENGDSSDTDEDEDEVEGTNNGSSKRKSRNSQSPNKNEPNSGKKSYPSARVSALPFGSSNDFNINRNSLRAICDEERTSVGGRASVSKVSSSSKTMNLASSAKTMLNQKLPPLQNQHALLQARMGERGGPRIIVSGGGEGDSDENSNERAGITGVPAIPKSLSSKLLGRRGSAGATMLRRGSSSGNLGGQPRRRSLQLIR
ncbi:unnamed protein product [Amoebophrya sp. A120]|nr:unnamed protein product [Amoebophrya sp. A120]|eukprot:GSA120T00009340001.1